MLWKPCLRACIKFCSIFYTFHSVWLNFRVIDVHTNILNYIPCSFARSGNTFSRMLCQVEWTAGPSQILMDRLIGFGPMELVVFWALRIQMGLSDVKDYGWLRWISLCSEWIQYGTWRTISQRSTGLTETPFCLRLVIIHFIIADFLRATVCTSKWELPCGMHIVVLGHEVAQLVEALHYTREGRGFDCRWCHWDISLT